MKKEVSPVVAIALVVIVLAGAGFYLWKQSGGRSAAQGKMQSDLDMSKMEKDPEKFKKELDDLMARDRASKQGR
jgi:hypothetical protein